MLKIAIIMGIVISAALAGCGLTIVLATPALADQAMKLIPGPRSRASSSPCRSPG